VLFYNDLLPADKLSKTNLSPAIPQDERVPERAHS
jgi:hypothetical protein